MSWGPTDVPEKQQRRMQKTIVDANYVLTEEERTTLIECSNEAIWFRAVPISVTSMVITQALATKGIITGSIPKVFFAGLCGFMAGQFSYMEKCKERFKKMPNSAIGAHLRNEQMPPTSSQGSQGELSDTNTQSFDSVFQPEDRPGQMPNLSTDYGYNAEQTMQMEKPDYFNPLYSAKSDEEEERPKKKTILYENLRLKNRENYQVTLPQKAEPMLTPSPEREPQRQLPKTEGKKNIYGDTWEE